MTQFECHWCKTFLYCWDKRRRNKKQKHDRITSCLYIDTFFLCKHEKSVTTPSCFYVLFLCLYLPFSLVNPTTLNPIIELIEFWQENRFKVLDWLDLRRWSSQRYYHRARKWYNIDSNANGKQVPLPIARLFCASSTSRISLRKM